MEEAEEEGVEELLLAGARQLPVSVLLLSFSPALKLAKQKSTLSTRREASSIPANNT